MSWRRFFHRTQRDAESAREIQFHIDAETEDNVTRGMSPEAARAAARRKFGNPGLIREEIYRMNSAVYLEAFWQDLLYALRMMRKNPAFAATAVLLIALGIAANTQIFTLVNTLLLRPLAVHDPQNLVQLFEIRPKLPAYPYFDYALYRQFDKHSSTLFNPVGQMEVEHIMLSQSGVNAERIHLYGVTENFFTELGVDAALGRVLTKGDDHTAVLSYPYWVRAMGRDTHVIGQTVRLKGHPFQIVGVVSERFVGTTIDSGPDVWIPLDNTRDFWSNPNKSLDASGVVEVTARLRPGISLVQAQQETSTLWARYRESLAAEDPEYRKSFRNTGKLELRSIAYGLSPMRDQFRPALVLLLAGTALLLLMVCANVGGLVLAQATAREKETAVRLAVGASRGRLILQWLAESLLLTAIGGTAGIALAHASLPLLMRWMPPARGIGNDPAELRTLSLDLHMDLRVAAYSLGICAVTAMLAAFAPAWRAARHDLYTALKTTMSDARHRRFQSVLCTLQIALCTVLLVSAGLLVRSLYNLRALDTGFDREHVVIFSVDPQMRAYDSQQNWSFQRRLVDGARALPGVDVVAIADRALMRGIGFGSSVVFPGQKGDGVINTSNNWVTPEYFDVMGIRLLAGRGFTETDMAEKGKLAKVVVNEAFVQRFLTGQSPLGRQFAVGTEFVDPQFEVVGVVNNSKYRSLREVPPPIYYIYRFGPKMDPGTFVLHVRTHGDPQSIIQPMRRLVQSLDREMPFYQVATLSEEIDRSLWQERLVVALAACFGVFAMTLSAIGLYGILANFVTSRRREIGLRMALGANPAQVIWLVTKRLVPIIALGLLGGVSLSFLAGTWVRSLLYGVQPFDPWSTSAAVLLLTAIGIAAATVPTLRAIRVDPASTLRQE